MKFYNYLTVVVLLVLSLPALGQGTMIQLNYAPAMPLGNTGDFTSRFTGRGANVEFYKMSNSNFGFGVEFGTMNFYDEVPNQIFEQGTASLQGRQYRYIKFTPILGSVIYIFDSKNKIRPFVAMGAGLSINSRIVNMGIFVDKITPSQIMIRPELGIIYEVSDYVGIKVSSKYYQTFENNSMVAHSMMGFNLGFVMLNFNK